MVWVGGDLVVVMKGDGSVNVGLGTVWLVYTLVKMFGYLEWGLRRIYHVFHIIFRMGGIVVSMCQCRQYHHNKLPNKNHGHIGLADKRSPRI